jgi:hypothetical protein
MKFEERVVGFLTKVIFFLGENKKVVGDSGWYFDLIVLGDIIIFPANREKVTDLAPKAFLKLIFGASFAAPSLFSFFPFLALLLSPFGGVYEGTRAQSCKFDSRQILIFIFCIFYKLYSLIFHRTRDGTRIQPKDEP